MTGFVNSRGTILERMERFTMPEPNSGCTLFIGAHDSAGYGHIWWQGRLWGAHRVAYTLHVGPIPGGLHIDHLCRNTLCVNPAHLEAVPQRINTLRGIGPSARGAQATRCPQGHAYDDANTYRDARGRRNCRSCNRAAVQRSKLRRP
jgi:hypothetical protein